MPTRIDQRFAELKGRGEKGFIAFITAGDPDLDATRDIVLRLEDAGVDVVELGIPFSDPLADGRVNQQAATRALASGTTVAGVFEAVAAIRRSSQVPLLCYSYLNPLLAPGFDRSARAAAAAGVDGFLLLDLPVEEQSEYADAMDRCGLNNIRLVTPTSPPERIRRIVTRASGFIYCVSREGVTGAQKSLNNAAADVVERTRRCTDLPVALGFGIASPEQARAAAACADAIVVGSAIVERFDTRPHNAAGRRAAAAWVRKLVRAAKEA